MDHEHVTLLNIYLLLNRVYDPLFYLLFSCKLGMCFLVVELRKAFFFSLLKKIEKKICYHIIFKKKNLFKRKYGRLCEQ